MKNFILAVIFISLVAISIFVIPALLRHYLGVNQPVLTVISSSMWPKLSRGDVVLVMKTDDADIKVGSVIVFRHERGLAVHRVVSLDNWNIITKGDANVKEDVPILYGDVVGRVPAIGSWLVKIPWVGHISLLANPEAGAVDPDAPVKIEFWGQLMRVVFSPVGFIFIIGFPLIIIFQNVISEAVSGIVPMSTRKRRVRARAKRLQAVWGEAKTKRALRL